MGFYTLLPAIGWLAVRLPRRRSAQALGPLALLALGVLYNWAIAGRGLGLTFSKTLVAMLPYFAVGMLAALALHDRAVGPHARRALIGGGLAIVLADAVLKATAAASGADSSPLFVILRDLPSGLGFALVVGAVAATPSSRILGGRVLASLGAISYGFYLWHVPILLFMRGHGLLPLDPVLGTLAAVGPVLAISTLSWVTLERPIIGWARQRNARSRDERRARQWRSPVAASGGGGVDRRAGGREVNTVRT